MVRSGSLPLISTHPLLEKGIAVICVDSFMALFVEVCKTGWCSFKGAKNKRTTLATPAIHTGVINKLMNEGKQEAYILLSVFR